MQVINPQAAGIDIGSTQHWVCVPPGSVPPDQLVRRFGAFTEQLDELVGWLQACEVNTVAMESTGVYWIALYQKLAQAGLEVLLVNARHVRHVPGRKTDMKDCQWLQQLHAYGLLRGAFRPSEGICQVRSLVRHRGNLVSVAAQQIQWMQKALQQMNVLLHHVVSDLDGQTGLRIIDAIVGGERDPERLIELRDERIRRSTPAEMLAALRGDWREEHLLVLGQALEAYRFFQQQIAACDVKLQAVLQRLTEQAKLSVDREPPPVAKVGSKKKKNRTGGNAPTQEILPYLNALSGVDLTQTMGISVLGSLVLISEIGTDMRPWPNVKAFTSWLGLAPDHKISGGKILSNRTRKVVNRASNILRLIALSVGKTDTVLGHFYRRIKARAGAPKAMTATARKLACLIYHLLKTKEAYVEPEVGKYLERFQKQRIIALGRQAKTLGFQLVPVQPVAN